MPKLANQTLSSSRKHKSKKPRKATPALTAHSATQPKDGQRKPSSTKSSPAIQLRSRSKQKISSTPSGKSTASALTIPQSPLRLNPYQKAWIQDHSRLKIAVKARRIGFSFAAGLGAVIDSLERKQNFIVLSRSERLSKEFIEDAVAPHVRAIGAVASYVDAALPDSSIYAHEVRLGPGSRIIALPANPETARSYEGNVLLDEFAFHRDPRRIYEAIEPTITRGYNLSIISTPNGQQGTYYELSKEAGLVEGSPHSKRWSPHKTNIYQAIEQGYCDRNGKPLDAEELRSFCLDEEMWLQEYCCQFLSTASQWIPTELLEANLSEDAVIGDPHPHSRNLYAGWDVARNRDLSVIWLIELVGDVSWTRGVIEMKNVPTPEQMNIARRLMPNVNRMVIDKSSMGLAIFEQLEAEYGPHRVEGVQFTLGNKEALAVYAKRRMEETKVRIPDTEMIRNSFRSVKKTVTATGQPRFDAEHDEKFGHADHWWAFCMAESAHATQLSEGIVTFEEPIAIASDLDEFDFQQGLGL